MKKLLIIILPVIALLLFTIPAYADELLIGYDSATAYDGPECSFIDDATTISGGKWKMNRFQAHASGTLAYFQLRVPDAPTGCTDDDGCYAIYEAGSLSVPGALKAYTCWTGRNWVTEGGVGVHNIDVETTITDLTITSGSAYWLVVWSQAMDSDYYSSAGCSSQILAYRGPNNSTCADLGGLYTLEGTMGEVSARTALEEVGYTSVPPPPANTTYDVLTATYRMMGAWSTDAEPETPANAIQGVTISELRILP